MDPIKNFWIGIKAVVINNQGKALVLKLKDQQGNAFWDFAGGRIINDENVFDTLKREVMEELPEITEMNIKGPIFASRLEKDLTNGNGLFLVFFRVDVNIQTITQMTEHSDHKWVDFQEAINLCLEKNTYISPSYLGALIKSLSVNN
ncbi:MAG: NUDIX hydrolase [bacterium]